MRSERNDDKKRPKEAAKPEPSPVAQVKFSKPNLLTMELKLTGTAPYLQCRFSQKAINKIREKQALGDAGNSGKRPARQKRNFEADYLGSMHKLNDNQCGIPAAAFRAAAISACRLVGFKMTMAKLSVFVLADGFDVGDQTPLVKIEGKPEKHEMMGRNSDGSPDIRVRAIWKKWSAVLRVRFDADQFGANDIYNLFCRVGAQVGIGEGRPDSKNSAGMGFGTFDVSGI